MSATPDRLQILEARAAHLEALVAQHEKTLEIQFERIAQLQAEIDVMRAKADHVHEVVVERRTLV